MDAQDHAPSGLTDSFNKKSVTDYIWSFSKHMLIMGACMAIPAMALAAPVDSTLLGMLVETGHQTLNMAQALWDGTPTLLSNVWDNAINGDILPHTWDQIGMDHTAMGHTEDIALHAVDHSALSPMEWFKTLSPDDMLARINEAKAIGVPFEEYITAWCDNNPDHYTL